MEESSLNTEVSEVPKTVSAPSMKPSILENPHGKHTCLICDGKNQDGVGLNFKESFTLKKHYAECFYKEGAFPNYISPCDGKEDEAKYRCRVEGCTQQKIPGAKGLLTFQYYVYHMATKHGLLEQIIEKDGRPFLKQLIDGLKKYKEYHEGIIQCRFPECNDNLLFNVGDVGNELKIHYARAHYKDYLQSINNNKSKANSGSKRTLCLLCGKAGRTVYVNNEQGSIGHLVIAHDKLKSILTENTDEVSKKIYKDLYQPENLDYIQFEQMLIDATNK